MWKIAVLPGDGVGPEVVEEALRILALLASIDDFSFYAQEGLVGGAAIDALEQPLPAETLELALDCQAVLFGAVGGPAWDHLPAPKRPEAGLLGLRKGLGLYANLRPARTYPGLVGASPLRDELAAGMDILILRELTGDVYFGEPRGWEKGDGEDRAERAFNTMVYTPAEVERIAHRAFRAAAERRGKVTSVDKANVLETSRLWREVVVAVAKEYPDVALDHLYVDNAAMQLIRRPGDFDVILTGNLFGDILSDEAAAITGSIGLLPSASLGEGTRGFYEPIHGSAPDIAGKNLANPLAAILSVAMMLRHSFKAETSARRVERAVEEVLAAGYRTADLPGGQKRVGTREMTDLVLDRIREAATAGKPARSEPAEG